MNLIIRLTYFFLIVQHLLYANVEHHLKKISNYHPIHRYKNIDYVYMINLDQRPEKFLRSLNQLEPFGVYPYRFSAVNGWELPLNVINDVGLKYTPLMLGKYIGTCYPYDLQGKPRHELISQVGRAYFCHCMSRGAIGIVLSHLSVLQDAWEKGYQRIWVMEDDIEVIDNPKKLAKLIRELDRQVGKNEWDILFTDQDTKNVKGEYVLCLTARRRPDFFPKRPNDYSLRKKVGKNFIQLGCRYGAYSMIINRSGIQKLLHHYKKHAIFFPYDMEYFLPPTIKLFTVRKDIVGSLANAISDNGVPNYARR